MDGMNRPGHRNSVQSFPIHKLFCSRDSGVRCRSSWTREDSFCPRLAEGLWLRGWKHLCSAEQTVQFLSIPPHPPALESAPCLAVPVTNVVSTILNVPLHLCKKKKKKSLIFSLKHVIVTNNSTLPWSHMLVLGSTFGVDQASASQQMEQVPRTLTVCLFRRGEG